MEWLESIGVQWVDGRAEPDSLGQRIDCTDVAVQLAQFCDETAGAQGGMVDRKPHLQRISADFGGALHDPGDKTRLGGRHTQAMLNGDGPGATGLRRWWMLLEDAINEVCSNCELIQMFVVVASGQGLGATTGEPHADAAQCRTTRKSIGARGTIHLTADDAAAREFRMGPVELERSGDKSLRVASHSLQADRGADGRRHLPAESGVSRVYTNLDVSILNAEGLGVVVARDGTQTGHEGGLAPLGGLAPAGCCTMHGGIVFSLSAAPPPDQMALLASVIAKKACASEPGLRFSDPARWLEIRADHGAGLIQSIQPSRKRPPKGGAPESDIIGCVLSYNGAEYRGRAEHYDAHWTNDPEEREVATPCSVDGQLFAALDRVRQRLGVIQEGTALYAQDGRPPVFSRCARTDRSVDALCNVMAFPLEKALLARHTIEELVERINEELPADIRVSTLFETSWGFNAKQFCEFRQYEMLVPVSALGQSRISGQRQVWYEWATSELEWRRRSNGGRGLIEGKDLPEPMSLQSHCVEWTQRRRLAGQSPPMVRVALLVQSDPTELQPKWFASAVGAGRCYAPGAAVEYFGCCALAHEEQWELQTLPLSDALGAKTLWRRMDEHTLQLHDDAPAPLSDEAKILRLGIWCDSTPFASAADERATHGSTSLLQATQQATALAVLSPLQRERLETLGAGQVFVSPVQHTDGRILSRSERGALCAAINALNPDVCCSIVKQGNQHCLNLVHREDRPVTVENCLDPFEVLEVGLLQLVEYSLQDKLPADAGGESGAVVNSAASATAICAASSTGLQLCRLLERLEGDRSFHNFSTSLLPTQRKCQRQLARAGCSGFVLQRGAHGEGAWSAYAVLSFTAKGFLFHQIQHMVGSIAMVMSGELPDTYLHDAFLPSRRYTPCAPSDGLSLVSCCYRRKVPRPSSSPVWIGPRAFGCVGIQQAFVGDVASLLDWRSALHRVQARRASSAQGREAWGDGLVEETRAACRASMHNKEL